MSFQFLFQSTPFFQSQSKNSFITGLQLIFIVNRLQVSYILLLLPTQLISGDKYWVIIIGFLVSQLNLFFISRWLEKGVNMGVPSGIGKIAKLLSYPLVIIGVSYLILKFSIILIGYAKVVQLYLLREDRMLSILIILFIIVAYLTYQGVENISRFSILSFLFSAWIVLIYIELLFSPSTTHREFLPIWNGFEKEEDINHILFIISCFSGPELIFLLKKRIRPNINIYKYCTIGNSLSLLEFSFLFYFSVVFFGPDYLKKIEYPLVTMARYINSPFVDRLEMFIIPFFMFPLIFSLSLVNLSLYRGLKFIFKFKTNYLSYFLFSFILLFLLLFIETKYLSENYQSEFWLNIYIYFTSVTYIVVPLALYLLKRMGKYES